MPLELLGAVVTPINVPRGAPRNSTALCMPEEKVFAAGDLRFLPFPGVEHEV